MLELQRVDSTIDRLEARRRNLPEQAALELLEEQLTSLEKTVAEQQAVVDEIASRQRKLEADLEKMGLKIAAEQAKMYGGAATNPKELVDLQREVESLKRRISLMEDDDLGIMEEREGAEGELTKLAAEAEGLRGQISEAVKVRDRASADIDEQLNAAVDEREQWAPKFDAELLAFYDELRAAKGGVAAAALVDGACQGCHMRLPAQEYDRVRRAAGLVRCDECRRILVVV